MNQIKSHARQAGLFYLALAIIAPFSLSYVPSVLSAAGGVSAATISKHHLLLQTSMMSEIIYQIIEIYIVLSLYALFRGVNRRMALQMLVLGLLPIPIVLLNEVTMIASITVANGAGGLREMAPEMQNMVAVSLYGLHQTGIIIASIFWGLWLFPLGCLIRASRFLPNALGWSVILGGLGYIVRATVVLGANGILSKTTTAIVLSWADLMILGEVPVIAGLLWLGFRNTTRPHGQTVEG